MIVSSCAREVHIGRLRAGVELCVYVTGGGCAQRGTHQVCESVGVHTRRGRAPLTRPVSWSPTSPLGLHLARQPCSQHRQHISD